ncbi:hypothetical protein [Brevundimonas bacteroides]|uniref:hypothetical protein n=1 Tax=Brevundimonas bacteroides TaxID=74311 RepID=UPI00049680FA|nr:hypothetical protein [Brevundimonas bacteroides]
MSVRDARPSIDELVRDPAVRGSVKAVLRAWADRDPLDAAEDATLLAQALERAADEALAAASRDLRRNGSGAPA